MEQLEYKGIKVKIFTDAKEYTSDWDLPYGAVLDETSIPESAGLANITDNEISIFFTDLCSFKELLSTVSHELGHLAEGGFKKNPPQKPRYDKRHEQKAEHYEQFSLSSYELTRIIYDKTFKKVID